MYITAETQRRGEKPVASSTKNICIVGCGAIGKLHAKNLARSALKALPRGAPLQLYYCSRTRINAEKYNRKFNGAGVFDSFEDVLTASHIDAVVISSPPDFHKEQAIAALRSGKHVLVEKPMCVSAPELVEIENAVNGSHNKIFMVAENYYYKPSLKKIKALVREGYIGELKSVSVKKEFIQTTAGWKKKYGALLEGGIHFIALISGIIEDAPETVEARFPGWTPGKPGGAQERSSVITLRYKSGVCASLRYSWNTKSLAKGLFQHSTLEGDKGRIVFESNGMYAYFRSSRKKRSFSMYVSDVTGHEAMTSDFLRCIENPSINPYSDFFKAKRDLGIVFKAYT